MNHFVSWVIFGKEQEGDLVTLPDSGTQATNPSDFGSPVSETGATMGRPQDVPGAYKWGKKVPSIPSQLLSTTGTV